MIQKMSESEAADISGKEILSEKDTQIQTPRLWIDQRTVAKAVGSLWSSDHSEKCDAI